MEKTLLTFDRQSFYLNGKPVHLFSGDVHYFRIHPSDWDRRLDLCVDFGLNAVQVYVPWNGHEPEKGQFCFEGLYDLESFLEKCQAHGLYVLFRPSPYICSEWDFGGLPYWLLRDHVEFRTYNRRYLNCVRSYYNELLPRVRRFLSTNGGPIIACAVENEYGSYGNDHRYLEALAQMLRDGGIDVPLYATDGDEEFMALDGEVKGAFHGMNFSSFLGCPTHAAEASAEYVKNAPFFAGEFWGGRPMLWGERLERSDPAYTASVYQEALDRGCNVNIYMFSGGTNFGFMGGANYFIPFMARKGSPERFTPRMTSYDADAPVREDGTVGEKYFLLRDITDRYQGREPRPHVMPEHPVQTPEVCLTETADFFENLDALTVKKVRSAYPKTFEEMSQDYGLAVYTQVFEPEGDSFLVTDPMDRALMFVNGKFAASFLRNNRVFTDTERVENGRVLLRAAKEKKVFDIVCENLGRVNFGKMMRTEHKGIGGIVHGENTVTGCVSRSVPLRDLTGLRWKKNDATAFEHRRPVFLKGSFTARANVDTYVDTRGFDHGCMWVNGFNLGRYDCAGPQYTLYVPGGLLKDGENEIVILDLSSAEHHTRAAFTDHLILEGEGAEMK